MDTEVIRARVLEDVLEERERQDMVRGPKIGVGYTDIIRLASICFAWAEALRKGEKREEYC